ncbi:RAMP superfamily CRISPR-associated protein [Vibrio sp. FJH11]
MSEKHYARVRYTLKFTTESDLHIGDGTTNIQHATNHTDSDGAINTEPVNISTFVRDNNGNPFIPSSTFRGLLSAHFQGPNHEAIFGAAKAKAEETQTTASPLLVSDGMSRSDYTLSKRTRTAINDVTATAKSGALYCEEIVYAGAVFEFTLELEKPTQNIINHFDALLNHLGEEPFQLGRNKTTGNGKGRIHIVSRQGITYTDLKTWLLSDSVSSLEFSALFKELPAPAQVTYTARKKPIWKLHVKPLAPILINDAARTQSQSEDNEGPDHNYMQRGDCLLIPGTTSKGLFRARSRKITLTITRQNMPLEPEKATAITDALISEMYGDHTQASLVSFSDIKAELTQKKEHHQTFVAIDRFTGGAKKGALFNATSALTQPFQLHISGGFTQPEHLAIWYFTLRDIMEGDVTFGWGQTKGYGRFVASSIFPDSTVIDNWQALVEKVGKANLEDYFTALLEKVTTRASNELPTDSPEEQHG